MGAITRGMGNGGISVMSKQTVSSVSTVVYDLSTLDPNRVFNHHRLICNMGSVANGDNMHIQIGTNSSTYITNANHMAYTRGAETAAGGTPTMHSTGGGGSFVTWYTNTNGSGVTIQCDIIGLNQSSSNPAAFFQRTYLISGTNKPDLIYGVSRVNSGADYRFLRVIQASGSNGINGDFTLLGIGGI
tara:strand:+ start:335 stop:895 length:561 start_codon:yes stop_codon:yes gene_type:complete